MKPRYSKVRNLGIDYSDVMKALGSSGEAVVMGERDLTLDEYEKLEAVAASKPKQPFNEMLRAATF